MAPVNRQARQGSNKPRSPIKKRSIDIGGHKTSVSLEEAFWQELKAIASNRGVGVSEVIAEVDGRRAVANLSSALRVYVLETLQRADPAGR